MRWEGEISSRFHLCSLPACSSYEQFWPDLESVRASPSTGVKGKGSRLDVGV